MKSIGMLGGWKLVTPFTATRLVETNVIINVTIIDEIVAEKSLLQ